MSTMAATEKVRTGGMTKDERFVILASSLGTVFEWYDFYLFGSLASVIGAQFFGGFGDLIERATALNHNFTSQRGINMPATQDMQSLPRVTYETFVGPLPTHRSVAEVVSVEYRFYDVDQRNGRGVATGQLHRRFQSKS